MRTLASWAGIALLTLVAFGLTLLAFALIIAPAASAAQVSSVLGIPCTTQSNGVQACIGDTAHRVHSWDGVPLDVNVWVPPASQNGPFPLIAFHHGWGGNKDQAGADPNGADGEVLLDIEVAGALAPKASLVVYFAPNTDAGFLDAISEAAHATPAPAAISISWGQSEDAWTGQARTAFDQALADAAALGVTVTVAAGDDGSTDRATDGKSHVDFPASSPHALACGGTRLEADPGTGAVTSETVWDNGAGKGATGGGVSDAFSLPSWQKTVGVPSRAGTTGRGVPDVAGVADPQTGYQVRVDGKDLVIGGTSAVAPLWAALVARLAQSTGRRFGLLQPALYGTLTAGAVPPGFRDITSGSNGAYSAGNGWDPCTGLGVPDGTALLTALRAGQPAAA